MPAAPYKSAPRSRFSFHVSPPIWPRVGGSNHSEILRGKTSAGVSHPESSLQPDSGAVFVLWALTAGPRRNRGRRFCHRHLEEVEPISHAPLFPCVFSVTNRSLERYHPNPPDGCREDIRPGHPASRASLLFGIGMPQASPVDALGIPFGWAGLYK